MNKLLRSIIIVFFTSVIGSFFSIGTSIFIALRYGTPIAIIILALFLRIKISFDRVDKEFIIFYAGIFFLYPMILILFDVFNQGKANIIINSLYYIVTITCCLFIARYYNIIGQSKFYQDIGLTGFIFLIVGSVMFRDLSISIPTLISNMLSNERLDRSYLGFTNPNQVAILVALVIISILISHLRKSWKVIITAFCVLVLVNTGSRTPIIAYVVAGIGVLITQYLSKKSTTFKSVLFKSLLVDVLIITLIYVFYKISDSSLNFYYTLDNLSTNRISRQLATIQWLASTRKIIFGLGMFNTSFFNSQASMLFLHTDSYYTYVLATMGIIGLLGSLISVFIIFYKAIKYNSVLLIFLTFLCATYGVFEATLFFPTSVLTILLVVSFFLNKGQEKVGGPIEE